MNTIGDSDWRFDCNLGFLRVIHVFLMCLNRISGCKVLPYKRNDVKFGFHKLATNQGQSVAFLLSSTNRDDNLWSKDGMV